jgi:hypothetical protein
MSTFTFRSLATDAYEDMGVVQPGEVPEPALLAGALRRANQMLGAWSLLPLTIPVVAREVFPITSNLGVYTMGPGGDFDTSRPNALTGAGLLLNNNLTAVAVTSVTRSGNVATVTTATNHGLASGQPVTVAGAVPYAYNGTVTPTVTGLTTFTYLVAGAPLSPATGTITVFPESALTSVTEIPLAVITDDGRQFIQNKSLTSTLPTNVYFNPTTAGGFATITLWPVPTVSTNALVLYRLMQLASFTSLSAQYTAPEGAEEALKYNLAVRLLTANGIGGEVAADIREMARTTLGTYKRGNVKMSDLPMDRAFTMDRRGGYNILTGGYTGGGRS